MMPFGERYSWRGTHLTSRRWSFAYKLRCAQKNQHGAFPLCRRDPSFVGLWMNEPLSDRIASWQVGRGEHTVVSAD